MMKPLQNKYSDFGILQVLEVGFLFLLVALFYFKFEVYYNEMDVIPFAKATFNPDWLPVDWYLNQTIPYRFLFDSILGVFADSFGIMPTIVFGRLFSYLLIAFSIHLLLRAIDNVTHSLLHYFFIILFFSFFPYGMGAFEWMVGGLETKVFAYAFAILSLAFLLRQDLTKTFFFAGLSLSFHLLIGIYHLFCLIPLVLVYQKQLNTFYQSLISSALFFLFAGSLGIYGIFYQFFLVEGDATNLGWHIYVNLRVPHHVLPNQFPNGTWVKMTCFAILNVVFYLSSKWQAVRLMSLYGLFTILISLIGIAIFFFSDSSHHLKYYFFRFGDIMLPFITLLNLASFLIENKGQLIPNRNHLLRICVLLITLFLLFPRSIIF